MKSTNHIYKMKDSTATDIKQVTERTTIEVPPLNDQSLTTGVGVKQSNLHWAPTDCLAVKNVLFPVLV